VILSSQGYSLRRILHLELVGHPLARRGGAPADRLDAVHLLQAARGALLGVELEPGDGGLALEALGRVGRGRGAGVLAAGDLANLPGRRDVEVEEGRGAVEEEVHAADAEVGRRELLERLALRHVKVQRRAAQGRRQVRARGRDARRVEEGGHGADGLGRVGGGVGVARVVLRAAADGDVLEDEALGGLGEGGGA